MSLPRMTSTGREIELVKTLQASFFFDECTKIMQESWTFVMKYFSVVHVCVLTAG